MNERMNERMKGWKDERMNEWMNECKDELPLAVLLLLEMYKFVLVCPNMI